MEVPDFDPVAASARAIKIYDTDGDGSIGGDELEKAPGLKAAMANLDSNKDDKISEAELADRIRIWQRQRAGLLLFTCEISLDGKPLTGAKLTFEPEEFFGGTIEPAFGETSFLGTATPVISSEGKASPDLSQGIQPGIYKIRVSKIVDGKETIPAKYNSETILGQEVAVDDWAISNKRVRYTLKTK